MKVCCTCLQSIFKRWIQNARILSRSFATAISDSYRWNCKLLREQVNVRYDHTSFLKQLIYCNCILIPLQLPGTCRCKHSPLSVRNTYRRDTSLKWPVIFTWNVESVEGLLVIDNLEELLDTSWWCFITSTDCLCTLGRGSCHSHHGLAPDFVLMLLRLNYSLNKKGNLCMKLREHNKNYQFQGLLIRVCYKELIVTPS